MMIFDREQFSCCFGCHSSNPLNRNSLKLGDFSCDEWNIGRLVTLAAVRDGGKIWTIRLQQNVFKGNTRHDIYHRVGLARFYGKSDRTRNGDIKSPAYNLTRHRNIAGKAMEHSSHLIAPPRRIGKNIFIDDSERDFLRLTAVNNDWQMTPPGNFDLPREDFPLYLRSGKIVMIIQADLANGDDF